MNQKPRVICAQSSICAHNVMLNSNLFKLYPVSEKKKHFEQEDGVYAYQTWKNKYTLLTT